MREYITLMNHYSKLFEQVEVKPLESLLDVIKDEVVVKECYNNSFRCVQMLHMSGYNAQYIAGVAESMIAIDHAWICVDGIYYDPTWELHNTLKENYFVIAKLDIPDLVEVITNNNMCPPSSYELLTMHTDYVQNAEEVKEFMKGLNVPDEW